MSNTTENRPDSAQIAEWKAKYKRIFQIDVEDKILIMRNPSMQELEMAQAGDKKKEKAFNFHRSIIKNCKLYADDDLLNDDENMLAIATQLDEVIIIKQATVKEL